MLQKINYSCDLKNTWCPGCGNHVILVAMKNALINLKILNENLVFVSGIGCGSKFPHYVNTYGLETLHGRVLPNATGVKLGNKNLTVIAVAGDGDAYGIGLNHFIHTMRRNLDITYITQNNETYALTKGQASPTSPKGTKSKTTPSGVIEYPVNPIALALASNATFVARGSVSDIKHLQGLFEKAIIHHGIALVDVLENCPSMNKGFDIKFLKETTYKLENHDKTNWEEAMKKARETKKIPIGIFYQVNNQSYSDELIQMEKKALAEQNISNIDITKLLEKYK